MILRLYLKGIVGDGKMSNKKYYWLKLKEDFFDDKVIKYLRKLPDGNALVIIYLKMQLKSLKTEGFLQYDKLLPTYEEELALVLDEDINTVRFAITALIKLGVVERWEDDMLYMASMQQLIGSETAVAERVRRHRALKNKKTELLQCNAELLPSNTAVTNGNTEIERREKRENIEKEIEKREKKKTLDSSESPSSSSSSKKTKKVVKHKYGEYDNVLLSDEELDKLKRDFPTDYQDRIDRLSEYVASTGKTYKNYLATIRAWARKEKQEQTYKQPQQQEEEPKNWWEKTI